MNKVESMINQLNKLTGGFHQMFKEPLIPILSSIPEDKSTRARGMFPYPPYETNMAISPKAVSTRKENVYPIVPVNIDTKLLSKGLERWLSQ